MSSFEFSLVSDPTPHRDRHAYLGPWTYCGSDRFTCIISEQVVARLADSVGQHPGSEWMGLISGRTFSDRDGAYLVVSGVVDAHDIEASPGHVACPPEEAAEMRRRLAWVDPSGELIGWWHSHLGPSGFSSVDRNEQSTWSGADSIGLLVIPAAGQRPLELRVYRGPRAEQLAPCGKVPVVSDAGGRAPESVDATLVPRSNAVGVAPGPRAFSPDGPSGPQPPPRRPSPPVDVEHQPHGDRAPGLLAIVVATVAVLLALAALLVANDRPTVVRRVTSIHALPGDPSLDEDDPNGSFDGGATTGKEPEAPGTTPAVRGWPWADPGVVTTEPDPSAPEPWPTTTTTTTTTTATATTIPQAGSAPNPTPGAATNRPSPSAEG